MYSSGIGVFVTLFNENPLRIKSRPLVTQLGYSPIWNIYSLPSNEYGVSIRRRAYLLKRNPRPLVCQCHKLTSRSKHQYVAWSTVINVSSSPCSKCFACSDPYAKCRFIKLQYFFFLSARPVKSVDSPHHWRPTILLPRMRVCGKRTDNVVLSSAIRALHFLVTWFQLWWISLDS